MSRLALVEPGSLLGQSLREALQAQSDVELRLLGLEEEDYGTLTEVGGEITLVQPLTEKSLVDVDLAVLCGGSARQARALSLLPETTPAVVAATDFDHPEGALRVSGVNDGAPGAPITISPHPAVVMLSHLLFALADHAPRRIGATILLPASSRGNEGLDELFEQTRAILNFTGELPQSVFGRQLAFNLLPGPASDPLEAQVGQVLGRAVEIGVQLLAGPVFHGLAASLQVELSQPSDGEALEMSLRESPFIDLVEAPEALGPIDVAGRDEILVGAPTPDPNRPEEVRLWAVMDNLTRGGATNVASLARDVLDGGSG